MCIADGNKQQVFLDKLVIYFDFDDISVYCYL